MSGRLLLVSGRPAHVHRFAAGTGATVAWSEERDHPHRAGQVTTAVGTVPDAAAGPVLAAAERLSEVLAVQEVGQGPGGAERYTLLSGDPALAWPDPDHTAEPDPEETTDDDD